MLIRSLLFADAAGAAVFGAMFTVLAVFASVAISGACAGGFGVGVIENGKRKKEGGNC